MFPLLNTSHIVHAYCLFLISISASVLVYCIFLYVGLCIFLLLFDATILVNKDVYVKR